MCTTTEANLAVGGLNASTMPVDNSMLGTKTRTKNQSAEEDVEAPLTKKGKKGGRRTLALRV